MIDRELGKFLRDDERQALELERRRHMAGALQTQAHLLILMGLDDDSVQTGINHMRDHLDAKSAREIKKIGKALLDVAKMVSVPQVAVSEPSEQPAEEGQPTESGQVTTGTYDPTTDDTAGEGEVNEAEVAPFEIDEEVDERSPKRLSQSLNNAFGKSFTYGQRAALGELNEDQRGHFVALFEEIAQAKGNSRISQKAGEYAIEIGYMLKGLSNVEIGEIVGVHNSNISYAFSKTIPPFVHGNKRLFVEGYTRILAETPDLLELATNMKTAEDMAAIKRLTAVDKPKREKVIHPEGVPDNIDNALIQVLDFEQRAAIAGFNDVQREELVVLFNNILAKVERMGDNKDLWVGRFEQLLGGMSVREVANSENLKYPLGIIQGFSTHLPRALGQFREEFVAGFERILSDASEELHQEDEEAENEPSENLAQEDETANVTIDELIGTDDVSEEATPEAPNEDIAHTEETEEQPGETGDTADQNEPVQQEAEQREPEEFVRAMQRLYKTDDIEALRAIEDLFSTSRGVIPASEQTVEAARYLSQVVRGKAINLSLNIANPNARSVVENLLYGTKRGDDTVFPTFSEIIDQTAEGARENKLRVTKAALEKIASLIEGTKLVPVDARQEQVNRLRDELHKYIEVSPELAAQIVDRATEKDDSYTSELGKALLFLNRAAAGVGPDDMELKIVRWFTTPQMSGAPLNVDEIRTMLVKEQQVQRNGSGKQYDNGYVTGKLLRLFDKIVTQRRDG